MIEALIKGKLSLSEDILTSVVFGFLRNLPDILIDFLKTAKNLSGTSLPITILPAGEIHYEFWPFYQAPDFHGKGAQPDVVIKAGDEWVIVLEVKYISGKSGAGISEDEETQDIKLHDQLAREYFAALEKKIGNNFFILYVTSHSEPPEDEIKETIRAVEKIEVAHKTIIESSLYWTKWQALHRIAEDFIKKSPVSDISRNLAKEFLKFLSWAGFIEFQGFRKVQIPGEAFFRYGSHLHWYSKIVTPYWSKVWPDRIKVLKGFYSGAHIKDFWVSVPVIPKEKIQGGFYDRR